MKYFSLLIALLIFIFLDPVFAFELGTEGGTFFTKVVAIMQDIADFMEGPLAKFLGFASLIMFMFLWAWAPQAGALGGVLRVIIAIAIAFNAGAIILGFVG